MISRYRISVWGEDKVITSVLRDTLDDARAKARELHATHNGLQLVSVFDEANGVVVMRLEKR
jgi:hypothetical protein